MQAVRLEEPGRFATIEVSEPGPLEPGQALVAVQRIGVCGTDQHAFRGRQPFFTYPRILGHELGVEVVAVAPDVTNVKVGDSCAVQPYLHCGTCVACRRGRTNCCVSLKVLGVHTDGGWQPRIVVPAELLHPSDKLTMDQLALVETLAIGAHAVERAQVGPDDTVLILGAGPIGLAALQFALLASKSVILADINPSRLDFATHQLGATDTLLVSDDLLQQLESRTGGDLAHIVFDCTGSRASMLKSFELVAHSGKLVFVGLFIGEVEFHDPLFHRREMTLMSSRNATAKEFKNILALIESGTIDTTPWITHRALLAEVPALFPQWLAPESGLLKAVIEL